MSDMCRKFLSSSSTGSLDDLTNGFIYASTLKFTPDKGFQGGMWHQRASVVYRQSGTIRASTERLEGA